MLIRSQILVAEKKDAVIAERGPHRTGDVVRHGLGEIDPVDEGADTTPRRGD